MAPPAGVPLLLFGTGAATGAAGFGLAVAHARLLAAGNFSAPAVVATVHAFTLGLFTSSLMAALYQWVPVISRRPLARARLALWQGVAWSAALLLFVPGLAWASLPLLMVGGSLLALGAGLFLWVMAATLHTASEARAPLAFVRSALAYLALTVVLGITLDGHLVRVLADLPTSRVLRVHIVVAVGGWLGLTWMGVSGRLVPMFEVTRPKAGRYRSIVLLMHGAIGSAAVGIARGWPLLDGAAWASGTAALALYLHGVWQARRPGRLGHRDGPRLLMRAGGLFAAMVWLWGTVALAEPHSRAGVAVAPLVLGVFLTSLWGFGQKIWPFVIWVSASRRAGPRTLPHLSELWPPALALGLAVAVPGLVLAVAVPGLVLAAAAGLAFGVPGLVRAGAGGLLAADAAVAAAGVRMIRLAAIRRYAAGSRIHG